MDNINTTYRVMGNW